MFIVIRDGVLCEMIGPFATYEDAETWQQLDIQEKGDVEYRIEKLTDPGDAYG